MLRFEMFVGSRMRCPRIHRRLAFASVVGSCFLLAPFIACSHVPTPSRPEPGTDVAIAPAAASSPRTALSIAGSPTDGPAPVPPSIPAATSRPGSLTRYRVGPLYSPMTRAVVDRLKAVLAGSKGRRNVFMKVGDSITISNHFLKCFAEQPIDLGEYGHLEPTFRFFNEGYLGRPKTSFDRASMSTRVGWTARDPRQGSPSPLDKEWYGTQPAFAFLMFGTNGSTLDAVREFERELLLDVDWLLARGVIPLMSTVPPKLRKPASSAAIPDFNAVVRVIAQARQLPLMDYHRALQAIPSHGLADDGVHPRPHIVGSQGRGCWLTPEALLAGMNVRNLLALTTLDRMRRFVIEDAPVEGDPPGLAGEGTSSSPWVIDELPFVDVGEALRAAPKRLACGAEASASVEYVLELPAPVRLRTRVFGDPGVHVRAAWLSDRGECLADASTDVEVVLPQGVSRLEVSSGAPEGPRPGAPGWRLTIVPVE